MAPRLGIAPSQTGLEAVVLLLHQRGMEGKNGGAGGIRTHDLLLDRQALWTN